MIQDKDKYLITVDGKVLKIIDDHFLTLSPCNHKDKYIREMDTEKCHIISYNNACMIINKQYDAITEKWSYDGKSYISQMLTLSSPDDIEQHTYRIKLLPDHTIVLDDEGESELKLIKHKGKLYYILIVNERLPRVKAYDLFGKFIQWIGIQHCKGVWCEDDNEFI